MDIDEVTRYKTLLLRSQKGEGYSWEGGQVFRGRRGQRGFGFGSLLKSVGKMVLPFAKSIGKKLVKSALGVGQDLLEGKKFKESLVTRGKTLGRDILTQPQKGAGRKRKITDFLQDQEPWSIQATKRRRK